MPFLKELIAIAFVLLTVLYGYSVIFSPSLLQTNILLAVPVILFLSIKTELWWMIVIALFASQATLPGLPGGMNLFHLLAAGLVAFTIPYAVIHKTAPPRKCVSRLTIYSFIAVILFTMGMRGFGLQSLGGEMGGGGHYAILLTSAALALRSHYIPLSRHKWRLALLLMCALSILPLAAEASYTLTQGKVSFLYLFLNRSFLRALSMSLFGAEFGVLRFASAIHCAFPMALASLILWHTSEKKHARLGTISIIASFALAGISGHRISLISILIFLFIIGLIKHRDRKLPLFAIKSFATIIVLISVTIISIQHLPISFQRSLSWLPFTNASMAAQVDADTTVIWRIDLWKRALEEIPKHLLVGRGFSVSVEDIEIMQSLSEWRFLGIENYFVSHSYHNGPLWLLIDTGLLGFVLAIMFLACTIREHWHIMKTLWGDPLLARLHTILFAWFITKTITFFAIFGDLATIVELFFIYALMEGVARTETNAELEPLPHKQKQLSS